MPHLTCVLTFLSLGLCFSSSPPSLIVILTDDMGYNSPGFINSAVLTPHIDALAASGVSAHMYSYKFCSPTRASLLTGRFPWRVTSTLCDGRVCNYLPAHVPMGVHTGYSMLPQRLQEAGYVSYHGGKWHEGMYAPQFTPTHRGFNRSNGFLSGGEDHYTLAADLGVGNCGVARGLPTRDAFIDNATSPQAVGTYTATRFADAAVDYITHHPPASPLFLYLALHNTHAPLEAEPQDLALYQNISWKKQQTYYAMTSAVDRTVGRVVAALKAKGMWENSLLVWTTDNGCPVQVGGSNGAFRGGKGSSAFFYWPPLPSPPGAPPPPLSPSLSLSAPLPPSQTDWEGGVHVPAVFSGGLVPASRWGTALPRSSGAFHVADLHATILARAGLGLVDPNPRAPAPVDGLDVWPWVLGALPTSPRTDAGLPLDHLNYDASRGITGAYIKGHLKLLVGGPQGEAQAGWFGGPPLYFTPNASMPAPPIDQVACPNSSPPFGCLFNLTADPNEHEDIALSAPQAMAEMLAEFLALNATYHPPWIVPPSEEALLCAVALEQDNVAAPWRTGPLPWDQ